MRENDKFAIRNDEAPAPIGPYNQAIRAGDYIFVSGQLGLDAKTGELMPDVAGQTQKALENLDAILRMADVGLGHVVKTTVFVTDLADFGTVNEVYGKFFDFEPPARSCVQVAALPKGALVEIEAIAVALSVEEGLGPGLMA